MRRICLLRGVYARVGMDQRGVAMVLLALMLPVFLALGSIVITVGNWYVHKKHLQTLVDAAAFAAAPKFGGCYFDTTAADAGIMIDALAYAGDTARDPATKNLQVQEPADVRVVLNSMNYWAAGDPTDGSTHDNTMGTPCATSFLDVKATDDKAPLLWGWIPFIASPKTHAKVEIRQVQEQRGMLPFAVPEVDPAAVAAIFVNENTGAVADWQLLMKDLTPPDTKFSYWVTPSGQEPVPIQSENTGVVIIVSKEDSDPMNGVPNTLVGYCNQAPGLVKCYGGSGTTNGVNFIHGWSDAPGSPNAPKIRDVSLYSSCSDPSAPYFLNIGDCVVGAIAKIDFGQPGNPVNPDPIRARVELHASASCGGSADTMSWDSTFGTERTYTGGSKTLAAASGRNPLSISWRTGQGSGAVSGCFPLVAAPYVANDASGPLEYVDIDTLDTPVLDANSRNIGPDRNVIVTVGLPKPLALQDALTPPILLRFASKSGSLNQALDCDSGVVFADEIAIGCQTSYGLNFDDPDGPGPQPAQWQDIACSRYGINDLPPPSFVNTPAPICIAAKTGDVVAMRKGLYDRFQDPACTTNAWPTKASSPAIDPEEVDDFFRDHDFASDPRYVTLIVTDITAFTGSGAENVPVKYFAGFYATGWDIGPAGGGNQTGCPDNDPHPLGLSSQKDNGDVWGHFVQFVNFSSIGLPSEELCAFGQVETCIAVLVE